MLDIQVILCKGDDIMVSIDRFSIKGFKNIQAIDLRLEKITSLLALNNYGKSNVIKAIDFGIDFITKKDDIRENMMCWRNGLPYNKHVEKKNFEFEIEFSIKIGETIQKVIYGYSFDWTSKKGNGEIEKEYLRVKTTQESLKYTQYIERNGKEATYKSSVTGSCDRKIKVDTRELVINKLLAYDDLFYLELVKAINNINIYIEEHFETSSHYKYNPLVLKDDTMSGLLRDGNVPRILSYIKENYPERYELIINTYLELFPNIEGMKVESFEIDPDKLFKAKIKEEAPFKVSDIRYSLYVKDKNLENAIPFDLMSDGAKRILLIFSCLTLAEINECSFIMIEEPENSVHPQLLQQYLISLDSFLQHAKLLITSHSPYLMNYLNPTNLYIGIPNCNGLANFCKIKDTAVKKLMNTSNELDILTGDYLFDLMNGTEEDIEVLSSYVQK
ncbi:MAG: ATP-binding protein [Bacilli bacterium]|nr:ATP-binding protein [Bacilli bacterium]